MSSVTSPGQAAPLVVPVPCLRDNYAYIVFLPEAEGRCVVVDACEAAPVLAEVQRRGLTVEAVLTTHHHADHVGGNLALAALGVGVIAHASEWERVPGMTRGVQHGEVVKSAELEFTAWHVPGHTLGALCYSGHNLAFTGDTLFTGGCGRLFEGAPAQMIHSLVEVIGALPSETELYTGHEYTASNLKFAQMVEGSNLDVRQRYASVAAAREHGAFTASASLKVELSTNPFLRCHVAEIRQHVGAPPEASLADVFALLRRAKDAF